MIQWPLLFSNAAALRIVSESEITSLTSVCLQAVLAVFGAEISGKLRHCFVIHMSVPRSRLAQNPLLS